jgi:hypothetical protein
VLSIFSKHGEKITAFNNQQFNAKNPFCPKPIQAEHTKISRQLNQS